jgi:hypothetical protein
MKKESTINRRIVKSYLRQWVSGGWITMAEAIEIFRSEANKKGTGHLMMCTVSSNIRKYWVNYVKS